MSDNILIDVSTTIENVNVEVVEASAASIGIEYFYPQGPVGPQGPQGVNTWGSLSGTLSAQTDLWAYLSADSDAQTLSYIPSSYLLSILNGNTVNLSSINSTFAANSGKYESVYSNVQTNSANWNTAYNTSTAYQANSGSYATTAYTDSAYLHISGGTLIGNLSVYGNTFINNNLTVGGNLTALGIATFANTIFTTTSALSVYNTGPGPALYVFQASGPYDVASFYDGDGIEVLHVGNAGLSGLGKVGVNESFPNKELTVRGSISATGSIFATSFLSGGVDLKDIFLTSETDSQTLYYTESASTLFITNGNSVSLTALDDKEFATAMAIALS